MSDEIKIKDINETEHMVDEVTENSPIIQNEKPSFFASCAATVSDAIIIAVVAYVLLYVVDFILRQTIGLYIVEKNQMLFLLYVVVSLLYVSILESKLGFTVGKTVFGIKVARN